MEEMTQTNASTAEASAGAGETLNTEARESLAIVERLEALVGQGGGAPAEEAGRQPAADDAPEISNRAAA
jgi:hypothetical protein